MQQAVVASARYKKPVEKPFVIQYVKLVLCVTKGKKKTKNKPLLGLFPFSYFNHVVILYYILVAPFIA